MLELKKINKVFANKAIALKELNLFLPEGEVFGLLGPSGCGKTTALRIIAGLESPSNGQVILDGKDITKLPPEKRGIGFVFQDYALFPHLTVFQNVAFGLLARRVSNDQIQKKVKEVLKLVQISELANRLPKTLSGGQRQRTALARALVIEPKLLLLDEPLSALDAKLREILRQELRILLKKLKITTLFVTHDQVEALTLGDRIGIMQAGELVQIGTPQTVYKQPVNSFIANFIGNANFFSGKIISDQKIDLDFTILEKQQVIDLNNDIYNLPPNTPVEVLVRPEQFIITSKEAGFAIKIEEIYFLGDRFRILGKTSTEVDILVDLPSTATIETKKHIYVSFTNAIIYVKSTTKESSFKDDVIKEATYK